MAKRTVDQMKQRMWEAVEEIYVDMWVHDVTPAEIKEIILDNVKIYIADLKNFAQKETHGLSAHKRRKLR